MVQSNKSAGGVPTSIDGALKKFTELSSNVVSLQELLSDKHSCGTFDEMQLNALVRKAMPEPGSPCSTH